jgi:hypothetical protein
MFLRALADNALTLQLVGYGSRLSKEMSVMNDSFRKMIRNGEQEHDDAIINKARVVYVRWLILKAMWSRSGHRTQQWSCRR